MRERLHFYLAPGLAALLVIIFFALAFFMLADSRESHLRDAEQVSQSLAQRIDEQTARKLQSVDHVLTSASSLWQQIPALRDPAQPAMHALLAQKIGEIADARSLFVLDAKGMLVQDSDLHPAIPRDHSTREYFNWHRSHSGGLFIGQPVIKRNDGEWFIVASRRLNDAQGRFAGAIGIALEPDAFGSIVSGLDAGPDSTLALIHEAGAVIASAPQMPSWMQEGGRRGGMPLVTDLATQQSARTFRNVSAVDGVARIYSTRRVAGTPLIAEAGLSESAVLAAWHTERNITFAILVALILATIVLVWLIMQRRYRRSLLSATLASNEQMLRQVLDTLPVGVRVADKTGKVVLSNAASTHMLDHPADGVQPPAKRERSPAGAGKSHASEDWGMAKALASGEILRNEVVDIACADGSHKIVLHSAAPIVSADGEIVGGVAVNEDISERRLLADSLRESEARYQALFEHSIDAVLLMRADGKILSANRQACRLLGYTESELRARGREGLTEPNDPRVTAMVEEHRREGGTRGELNMRRKDGSWVPVQISSTTFRDRSGKLCASLIIRDITDRKRAEEHIEYLAYHDELTGIPNRAHFQRAFGEAIALHQRQGLKSALMVVDLDRFKNINDIIGHKAGDELLKQIASRLRACLRDTDVLARLGGDEFVILMQDAASMEAIGAVAHKILAATARPLIIDEQEFLITASIGISTSPHDGTDLHTLLRNSDVAMYRVKESGKNGFQFFSPDMGAQGRERLSIESALGRALERSEFTLHFQPKMQVCSRNIAGMEALVRWQNPDKGMMQPADFIAIAEETGMIVPIGDWVLTEACRQGQALRGAGHENLRVAVNLSVRQLFDDSLALRVSGALERTGFPAKNLELEITESMVMRDAEGAVKVLQTLRDTGVRIAIDDFGTGYSSLAYLKRFPIDCVKIDRSFIRDLPSDRDDASITRGIIAMAHNMQLEVVAEGVETVPQFEFLHTHGCDEIQGFLFSKPLGAEAFGRFLDGHADPTQMHPLHT